MNHFLPWCPWLELWWISTCSAPNGLLALQHSSIRFLVFQCCVTPPLLTEWNGWRLSLLVFYCCCECPFHTCTRWGSQSSGYPCPPQYTHASNLVQTTTYCCCTHFLGHNWHDRFFQLQGMASKMRFIITASTSFVWDNSRQIMVAKASWFHQNNASKPSCKIFTSSTIPINFVKGLAICLTSTAVGIPSPQLPYQSFLGR